MEHEYSSLNYFEPERGGKQLEGSDSDLGSDGPGSLSHDRLLALQEDMNENSRECQMCDKHLIGIESRDRMSNLPADLHFEIVSHLSADDLLHLSRVSHALRDIFLCKSSRLLWTTCLSNASVPPCPNDMTEPRYASLLFDTDCDFCGISGRCTNIIVQFELRVRLCGNCRNTNVKKGKDIAKNFDADIAAIQEVYTLVPHLNERAENDSESSHISLQDERFLESSFMKALKGYKDMKSTDADHLPEYVKEMQRKREILVEHCISLNKWRRKESLKFKAENIRNIEARISAFTDSRESRSWCDTDSISSSEEAIEATIDAEIDDIQRTLKNLKNRILMKRKFRNKI